MERIMKYVCVLGFLLALGVSCLNGASGDGECGTSSPDMEALNLLPCREAAQDVKASVPDNCCDQVKNLGKNPKCLCAVMLSNAAKSVGAKPEIAITIPKRCNQADRPKGYKCGAYTLP